jgi:ribosome-associated translation inhibitor RaiA
MNGDVRIRSADVENSLRTYIKRRLHFSLGRFAVKLGHIRVQVEDVAGARGTADKSCSIRAELLPTRRVLRQEAVDTNLYIAIDLATERIGRSFGRELERNQIFGTTREPYSPIGT